MNNFLIGYMPMLKIDLRSIEKKYGNHIRFNRQKLIIPKSECKTSKIPVYSDFWNEVYFRFMKPEIFELLLKEKEFGLIDLTERELQIIKTVRLPIVVAGFRKTLNKFVNVDELDMKIEDKFGRIIILLEDLIDVL